MNNVRPEVHVVADSKFIPPLEYLKELGVLDYQHLINDEDDQAQLAMFGGKLCYRAFEPGLNKNITKVRSNVYDYITNIHKIGHGSVIEHGSITFLLHKVSRVVTHEVVRHRIGTAFSQESLRFVRLTDLSIWKPEIFSKNPEASLLFDLTIKHLEKVQVTLAEMFGLDEPGMDFTMKKFITSHMRRLAPLGLATSIMITFNMRALRHIIQQRTAPSSEEEIRLVFGLIAEECVTRYPIMFHDFMPEMINGYNYWTTPFASMPYDQEKLIQKDKRIAELELQLKEKGAQNGSSGY